MSVIIIFLGIELEAVAVPEDERDIMNVYFPNLEGDKEMEFGNAPTQAVIPATLLIQRNAAGSI